MIRRVSTVICLVFMAIPVSSFADLRPEITAAAVETVETAQLVRLVVFPPPEDFETKTICSHEMIRVRLNGVSARSREIESLEVPEAGPLSNVRIVSRRSKGSVVQLFTKGRARPVCPRVSVSQMGGEIIITTMLSTAEMARKRRPSSDVTRREKSNMAGNPRGRETHKAKRTDNETDTGKAKKSSTTARAATVTDKRANETLRLHSSKSQKQGEIGAESEPDLIRYAAGFLFAVLVGCVALLVMKRKKRFGGIENNIEILSAKRLGPRQQLILTSVQGTKFLLAVSDKSVTTLGTLSDKGDDKTLGPSVDSMSKPRSLELRSTEPRLADRPRPDSDFEESRTSPGFDHELHQALGTAIRDQGRQESATDISSNVAGLIAMARTRKGYKTGAQKTPAAEA